MTAMALAPGFTIGPYEIVELIGAGGMGEVYRARDSRLRREVAVKLLPPEFAGDAERRARFEREARVLAGLDHSGIAAIHGLEEIETTAIASSAIVMELVEGPTLAEVIARGAMPIEEALDLAAAIAAALEAAHEHGVVHRDLKPGNIKVRPDGTVKVLDFGLAKALAPDAGEVDLTHSPTLSMAATRAGLILGTAAYMAPEQARGAAVDRSADLWALGCVLYEMLTGRAAFPGVDTTDVIAAVLKSEPDWTRLPDATPPAARWLLEQCLRKQPRQRLGDARAARLLLERARAELAAPGGAPARAASTGKRWIWGAAAAAVAALAFGLGSQLMVDSTERASPRVVRLEIARDGQPPVIVARSIAVSPDGTRIAYVLDDMLWVRALDRVEPVPLGSVGTSGGEPFFSPDGAWVGVFGTNEGLLKVSIAGGSPVGLVSSEVRKFGGSWSADDIIVYATALGLFRVPAAGGSAELLVSPDESAGEVRFAWPQIVANGRSVLFTIVRGDDINESDIAVLDLDTRRHRVILRGGFAPRYLPTGHLLYAANGRLQAVALDESLAVRSPATTIPGVELAAGEAGADFDVSTSGTLAYVGRTEPSQRALVWVDGDGREEQLAAPLRPYNYPRIAPDGSRAAVEVVGGNRDIWVWDFRREVLTRITDGPTEDLMAAWSADARRLFFGSDVDGRFKVYSRAADGSSPVELEFEGDGSYMPFSPIDDERLLVRIHKADGDIAVLHLGEPRRIEPLLSGPAQEGNPQVSPDGRWIAYQSDESGQFEIYVRSFPDVGRRREIVSQGGGLQPLWGPPGSGELYYRSFDGAVIAVEVRTAPDLEIGARRELFPNRGYGSIATAGAWFYAVSPIDGRFLMTKDITLPRPAPIRVVVDWLEELNALVPVQ